MSSNVEQGADGIWRIAIPYPWVELFHYRCPKCHRRCLTMRSYRRHYREAVEHGARS